MACSGTARVSHRRSAKCGLQPKGGSREIFGRSQETLQKIEKTAEIDPVRNLLNPKQGQLIDLASNVGLK